MSAVLPGNLTHQALTEPKRIPNLPRWHYDVDLGGNRRMSGDVRAIFASDAIAEISQQIGELEMDEQEPYASAVVTIVRAK